MQARSVPGRLSAWAQLALAMLAGLAHAASLTWPGLDLNTSVAWLGVQPGQPVWWLQVMSLAVLAYLLRTCESWRLATSLASLFGLAWFTGSVSWTFVSLHTYGGLPAGLALLAVLALSSLLALFYAAAGGVFVALRLAPGVRSVLAFCALWLLAELARGTWFTGFGWGASGYAHVQGPLAAYAPWLGVYGLCALSAGLAMLMAQMMCASGWRVRAVHLLVVAVLLGLPNLFSPASGGFTVASGRLDVTLLQGNIPQDEKFESGSGIALALKWYAEQLKSSRTALVLAPETAIALLPQQLPTSYWESLVEHFSSGQQAALIGMPLGDAHQGYTNSVVGLKPGQTQAWHYDKQHLVPFGEFIPPFFKWFTAMMHIPLGDFNRGASQQLPFEWQGQRLSSNICYENLFGEELGVQFADPALTPNLFVNVSNLAWFGDGLATDQHLQITRMRALEFERAFVLATNSGATAIVDHGGRITSSLKRATRGVLVGQVEGRSGITPYAWWVARLGLWPLWLLALALLWPSLRRRPHRP
jgi:apolipoprotein N-acyltransferase